MLTSYSVINVPDSPQTDAFTPPVGIPAGRTVHLRVEIDYERLYFAYRVEGACQPDRLYPRRLSAWQSMERLRLQAEHRPADRWLEMAKEPLLRHALHLGGLSTARIATRNT